MKNHWGGLTGTHVVERENEKTKPEKQPRPGSGTGGPSLTSPPHLAFVPRLDGDAGQAPLPRGPPLGQGQQVRVSRRLYTPPHCSRNPNRVGFQSVLPWPQRPPPVLGFA